MGFMNGHDVFSIPAWMHGMPEGHEKRIMGNLRSFESNRLLVNSVKGAIVFWAVLIAVAPSFAENDNLHPFRIGTGGRTGAYFPIGKIIAQAITTHVPDETSAQAEAGGVPGYIGVAQISAGSIENVRSVISGDVEAGLVQADVASWAYRGEHVFKGNPESRLIRALASLYPEKFQIVTRRDANIKSVEDLRGKHISIDEVGSGTLAVMRIVLEVCGMSEKDLLPAYLKPVLAHDKMVGGELQGFVIMAGTPTAAVSRLWDIGISLVPISPSAAARIEAHYPYLVPGQIPADAYPGIEETPTIQVHALLVVNAAMEEELAYKITASLWSQRTISMLRNGHALGKSIAPEKALMGISIPLHPGANKYYKEQFDRFEGSPSK